MQNVKSFFMQNIESQIYLIKRLVRLLLYLLIERDVKTALAGIAIALDAAMAPALQHEMKAVAKVVIELGIE